MRKLNTLFFADKNHEILAKKAQSYRLLQQFWHEAVPEIIANASIASKIDAGKLIIHAQNAGVASKIKFSQNSILSKLQALQSEKRSYAEYRVSSIETKVHVTAQAPVAARIPRTLSPDGELALKNLEEKLQDSPLALSIHNLISHARKTHR